MHLIDIDYKIGPQPLFHRLNANFTSGITAIVGANGCGKSTLLRILAGICQPSDGKLIIHEQDLYHTPQLKEKIGYVPATPFLYPHLTVIENIKLCARLRKINQKMFKSLLPTILHQCNLFEFQQILFGKLSDGLKKRTMIASQLIHQPRIVILDEPCAELDPFQRQQLWELFQQWQSMNRMIIFSSHHLQEVSRICNHIYQLSQGQLHLLPKPENATQIRWQASPSSKVTPTLEEVCT